MSFGLSAAAIGGIAAGVGAVGGAYISSQGAKSAANTQANSANYAAELQDQRYQQMLQNLQPYMDLGKNSIPQLQGQLDQVGGMKFNFNPTMDQLEQTPGYQFALQQGMKNTNNALAAKGLNLSGAQAKGLNAFNTGLASQTYQQQYQNALSQFMTNYGVQSDQYNRLAGLVGLGQQSSAGVGTSGLQAANTAAGYLTSGAAAQAAGTVGSANAISGGLNSLGSQGLLYSLMNNNQAPAANTIYGQTSAGNPNYFTMPSGG